MLAKRAPAGRLRRRRRPDHPPHRRSTSWIGWPRRFGWSGPSVFKRWSLGSTAFYADDWRVGGAYAWEVGWEDWLGGYEGGLSGPGRWPFSGRIQLPYPPFVSVTQITYEDSTGADQVLLPSGWEATSDGVETCVRHHLAERARRRQRGPHPVPSRLPDAPGTHRGGRADDDGQPVCETVRRTLIDARGCGGREPGGREPACALSCCGAARCPAPPSARAICATAYTFDRRAVDDNGDPPWRVGPRTRSP